MNSGKCCPHRNTVRGFVRFRHSSCPPHYLGTLMGLIPGQLLKKDKLYKAFQVICGITLILFGGQLIYYVLNVIA
jgi:hypothetical protein